MTSVRNLTFSIGCSTLLCVGGWPSTSAKAQALERGVEGGAVGAIIGGILGGGKGAATGAAIGAGIGALSGAAEANARAQRYYGPPPAYGPPPPGYYGPPPGYGSAPNGYGPPGYATRPPRAVVAASISIAPPPLPVYDQPLCPGSGYVWTPGYWAYTAGGYYWVPGTWVLPPAVGLVWTPGYWGYEGRRYIWHAGYWGPHVGYYGGIKYGFGYFGSGYEGGYWDNGVFFYNTAVTRVDMAVITNTYNKTVASAGTVNNVSFNGPGGITAQPTVQEMAWSRERHTQPTALQVKHQRTASTNRTLFAAVNHGTPTVAATAKPGVFKGHQIVGPKAVVATTNGSVGMGSTMSDHKPLPQVQTGGDPIGSEQTGPSAGQQPAGGPLGGGEAVAKGGGAPETGKHAWSGPNGPGGSLVGRAGPKTGQQAPAGQNSSGAAIVNGQAGPGQNTSGGPHAFAAKPLRGLSGPQGDPSARPNVAPPPAAANEASKANQTATAEPAPKANAVLPTTTSSIAGDTPASTTSSATSAGPSGSSSKSPAPTSGGTAGSGGPTQTASIEPTINIPPGTTRFGIEIGTVETQAGLQHLWRDIRSKHAALVAGLQVRRVLAPDKKWQLIAGPFGSVAEATQVCGLFKKENLKCEATAFAGNEL
jgi:hypothetical protein